MKRQEAKKNSSPVTVRFRREGFIEDKFAMANGRMLDNMLNQFHPEYTEWKDPGTGKVVMIIPREFFDNHSELFKTLPEVEIY